MQYNIQDYYKNSGQPLQLFMAVVISPFQNTFVKCGFISDNIFLTSKLIMNVHKAWKVKNIWCALKTDFQRYIIKFLEIVPCWSYYSDKSLCNVSLLFLTLIVK